MKKVKIFLVLAACLLAANCALISQFMNSDETVGESYEMVRVPGGSFQMGSASGGNNNERPVHTVTLSVFYIGKYEVTQALYESVMRKNPSEFQKLPGASHGQFIPGHTSQPVENVSWYDAVEFCNRLSVREGLEPVYTISGSRVTANWNKNGYRLPTEAEWEYAARGGAGSPGNYIYAGSDNIGDVAWHSRNCGAPQMTGRKAPNSLGIYDMSGNVSEWCWDRGEDYSSEAQTDPTGPSSSWNNMRVVRGGSWSGAASTVRSTYRKFEFPSEKNDSIGFRLVLP